MNAFLGHLIAMLTRIAAIYKVHTPVHANLVTPETERTVLVRWVLCLSCCCCLLLTRRWLVVAFFFLFFPFLSFHFLAFPLVSSPLSILLTFLLFFFSSFLFFPFFSFSLHSLLFFRFFLRFSILSFPSLQSFQMTDVRKYLDDRCVPYGARFQISDGIFASFDKNIKLAV